MTQSINHWHAQLPSVQSAFRKFYSTETALVKVHDDTLMRMDRQEVVQLVMLNLCTAFDTAESSILLNVLSSDFKPPYTKLLAFDLAASFTRSSYQVLPIGGIPGGIHFLSAGICHGPNRLFFAYV